MNPFDWLLHAFWQKLARRRPRLVMHTDNPFLFSSGGKSWKTHLDRGVGGWFPCSNHSFGYHGLLQQFWEHYGLGKKSLLVSETVQVAKDFS
jgi:hypothetical protein